MNSHKSIMELGEEIQALAKALEVDLETAKIEPNKIWLDGKVVTLWELKH